MNTQQIITTILYTATTVIILPLITLISKKLLEYIGRKTHNEKAANYLSQAVAIIETSVKCVMQTYVQTLKENGDWNEQTRQTAFNRCKDLIEKQLTIELREYLSNLLGDLDSWIESQIESTIHTININNFKAA